MAAVRLRILASHVYAICALKPGETVTLYTCGGVRAEVKCEPAAGDLAGQWEWDQITINGFSVGNRSGACVELAKMVHEVADGIHPDND